MSDIVTKFIQSKEDLIFLSKYYQTGEIKVNITKATKMLGLDRKTVRRYLNGFVPKKKRKRKKYLDDYISIIKSVLTDKNREFDYIDNVY